LPVRTIVDLSFHGGGPTGDYLTLESNVQTVIPNETN